MLFIPKEEKRETPKREPPQTALIYNDSISKSRRRSGCFRSTRPVRLVYHLLRNEQ